MSSQAVQGIDIVLGARAQTALAAIEKTREGVKSAAADMRATGKAASEGLGRDVRQSAATAGESAQAMARQIGSSTYTAGMAIRKLQEPVQGVGAALKGTQQAASGAAQAMVLLGEKASPQITALTNAVAGLAAGGFTPLGLAIAGVSVGFSLLANQKEEIVSVFAATEERVKSTIETLEKLRIEMRVVSQGVAPDASRTAIAGAEDELRRRQLVLARERNAGVLGSEGVASFWRNVGSAVLPEEGFLPGIDSAVERARKDVVAQQEYLRQLRQADRQQKEIAELTDNIRRQLDAVRRRQSDGDAVANPLDDFNAATLLEYERDQAAQAAATRRQVAAFLARQTDGDYSGGYDADALNAEALPGIEKELDAREKAIARQVAAFRKMQLDDGDYPEAADQLERWNLEMADAKQELTELQQLGKSVSSSLGEGFASAFEDAATGARNLGSILADVGNSLQSLLLQFAARGLGGAALGAFGASNETIKDFGFIAPQAAAAEGGTWRVGGSGGTDSQYVGMALTPGELVEVSRPGERSSAIDQVVVVNTTGQPTRQERSRSSDGREQIRVLVGQAVARDINEGGPVAQAIERSYGARRTARRGG